MSLLKGGGLIRQGRAFTVLNCFFFLLLCQIRKGNEYQHSCFDINKGSANYLFLIPVGLFWIIWFTDQNILDIIKGISNVSSSPFVAGNSTLYVT